MTPKTIGTKRKTKVPKKRAKAKRKKAAQKKKQKQQQRIRAVLTVNGTNIYLNKHPQRKNHLTPLSPTELAQQAIPKSRRGKLYGQGHKVEEIKLGNEVEKQTRNLLKKSSQKQRRKARRALCSVPDIFPDTKAGWKFMLLCMLALVLDLAAPDLPGVPVVLLENTTGIPESLRAILKALHGPTTLKQKGTKLRRPYYLRAHVPFGSPSPSAQMEDYLGGHVRVNGKKKSLWLPLSRTVFAIAPNLPEPIRKAVLESSPLAIPILCSSPKLPNRPIVKLDGAIFQQYDPKMLKKLGNRSRLIFAELFAFTRSMRKNKEWRKKRTTAIEQFVPKSRSGRFVSVDASPEVSITAMALAVFKEFLSYAVKKKWIKRKEAHRILRDVQTQLLPASVPRGENNADLQSAALAYNDPETLYQFLASYFFPTYREQVLQASKGLQGTMALVHQIDGTAHFITPRKTFAEIYAQWLTEHGAAAPWTSEAKPDAVLQRRLQDAGILFRGEKNNPATWRYAFWREEKKPTACLALPIDSLPEQVRSRLSELVGTTPADSSAPMPSEVRANQPEGGKAL